MALYLLLYYILQIWSLNKDNYTLFGFLLWITHACSLYIVFIWVMNFDLTGGF